MEARMTDQTSSTPRPTYDPVLPSAIALEWLRLCQTPLMLCTAWWNAALQIPWPSRSHAHISVDPHAQLIVPEPIEKDGEHALVA
jgi:hypothetical protein